METKLVNRFKDLSPEQYYEHLLTLKKVSTFWDNKNYGLKQVRRKDILYVHYKAQIDTIKNTYGDEELSELITDHVDFSEAFANNILAKDRALRIAAFVKGRLYNFKSLASTETQIRTESIDDNMAKFLSDIRLEIGKRLKELGK